MTSLFMIKLRAYSAIDQTAGEVRRRYITEVPGQQAVYIVKLEEAKAYLAALASDPGTAVAGPHLAAQAARTSRAAQLIAQEIVTIGGLWLGAKSPQIEAERMAGKEAVEAAQTAEAVLVARDAALAALEAL